MTADDRQSIVRDFVDLATELARTTASALATISS